MFRAFCISAIIGIALLLAGCALFESEESDMPGGLRIAGGGSIAFAGCDEPCIGITKKNGLNILYFSSNRTNVQTDQPGDTYRVYRCEQVRADSEVYRPPVLVPNSEGMRDFAVITANGADYIAGTQTDSGNIYTLCLTNGSAAAAGALTDANGRAIAGRVIALLPPGASFAQQQITVSSNQFAVVYQEGEAGALCMRVCTVSDSTISGGNQRDIPLRDADPNTPVIFAGGGSYVSGANAGVQQTTGFLLYARSGAGQNNTSVYITDFDTIDLPLALFNSNGNDASPIYVADENKVYMTSTRGGFANIYRWNRTKLDAAFADALHGRSASSASSGAGSANSANSAGSASSANSVLGGTISIGSHIMVFISAGSFSMGSPTNEGGRVGGEDKHSVTLTKGFYIGKYQVTQELYQEVMKSNPSAFSSSPADGEAQEKRPVETVSWYDALVFCNTLSAREGRTPVYSISGSTNTAIWGTVPTSSNSAWNAVTMDTNANGYRLPTEAEWEYACRAGSTTVYNLGDTWVDGWGWYEGNSGGMTHEVGKKLANAWGLHDMHGNVIEWCWDWYFTGYYTSAASQTDPAGPTGPTSDGTIVSRVARGGSWYQAIIVSNTARLRSAYRDYYAPSSKSSNLGFRVACTAP